MTLRFVRRVIVGVVGGTVFLVGLAMIVLPGPAFVVIPAGLAILATEFVWARRWLRRAKEMILSAAGKGGSPPAPGRSPDAVKAQDAGVGEGRPGDVA